jgi:glycosyltransferase involved in cell wall biosynthesis
MAMSDALEVLMLVGNTCVNDTRVLKEAQSLLLAGYRVTVWCDDEHGRLGDTVQDGVPLRRIDMSLRGSLPGWMQMLLSALRGPRTVTATVVDAAPESRGAARAGSWTDYAPVRLLLKLLRHRAIKRAALAACAAQHAQVVHAHDLETLPAAVALADRLGARLVYDAHELERHRVGLSSLESRVLGCLESRLIQRAARVITVCDSIAAHLARVCDIPLPVVVTNSPNLAEQRVAAVGLRAKLALPPDAPLAVYIGRLAAQRGVEQVLPVLVTWPELQLACVGGRDAAFAARLVQRANELGVTARLHLVDAVPPFEVVDFIRSADLAVVLIQDASLSYRYALPNKLFEATFAGVPVCASDLPEQRRFVEQAGNGVLVKGDDSDAIALAMREVFSRRAQLRPDAARLAAITARYEWQAQSRKLLALYEALR